MPPKIMNINIELTYYYFNAGCFYFRHSIFYNVGDLEYDSIGEVLVTATKKNCKPIVKHEEKTSIKH